MSNSHDPSRKWHEDRGISDAVIDSIREAGADQPLLDAIAASEWVDLNEIRAVRSMLSDGVSPATVAAWVRAGLPTQAKRLEDAGCSLPEVEPLLQTPGRNGLAVAVGALNDLRSQQVDRRDLGLWVKAGVVHSEEPRVASAQLSRWRQVSAVTMRDAAVCAAAGLKPDDVEMMAADGTFDVEKWRTMSQL